MKRGGARGLSIAETWELARSGELRGASEAALDALGGFAGDSNWAERVELHLVIAFCSMRQGHHAEALRELDAASRADGSRCARGAPPLRARPRRG